MDSCDHYSRHFIGQGFNSVDHARHYLTGLTGTQWRKNIETIENDVSGSDYQGMEQFISSSPWSHRALLDDLARGADETFGDSADAGLYIDESRFLKKGKASVGVQWQRSGRARKVDNCQVGVFASLGRGEHFCLIDFRLFLPEEWAKDPVRCDKAKIPKDQRTYKEKWELALEMVAQARTNEVRFGWVGVDGLYGHNIQFLNALEDQGEHFMADVRKDFKIWTREPGLEIPQKNPSQRGEPHSRRLNKEAKPRLLRVDDYVKLNFEKHHQVSSDRQGTKGKLCARVWVKDVWVREGQGKGGARKRRLIARQDESGDLKYSLTNLKDPEDLQRYLYIQNQRFWIEHSFHEAKGQTGMAQYQVRVWKGWHHHMALVCLATLFMEQSKQRHKESHPLLSYRGITELLDFYLPRRHREGDEVHLQHHKRHAQRQKDIVVATEKPGFHPIAKLTKQN